MRTWRVRNLHTGEVKFVKHYDNVSACEACGWKLSYCDCSEAEMN